MTQPGSEPVPRALTEQRYGRFGTLASVSNDALATMWRAIGWCHMFSQDPRPGFFTRVELHLLARISPRRFDRVANELVASGLLDVVTEGYVIHDLDQYGAEAFRRCARGELRRLVIARDGLICGICGSAVEPEAIHIDHIRPWIRGGATILSNLRVTHPSCNLSKGAS